MSALTTPPQRSVWIKTDLTPNGYVVTLEASDDLARILTPDEALAHAAGVLAAVARAEYDAAVLRQLTRKLDLSLDHAVGVIRDLRKDRPPLDPAATHPMTLEAGLTKAGKPFLRVDIVGEEAGQWSMEDARGHAEAVLESVAVADLDSGYLRLLTGVLDLDRPTATGVVDDLYNYREVSA